MPDPPLSWLLSLHDMEKSVYENIDRDAVLGFCIGRGGPDLPALKSGDGRVIELYHGEDVQDAMEVEDALIRIFIRHPKCGNANGRGWIPREEVVESYVYLVLRVSPGYMRII